MENLLNKIAKQKKIKLEEEQERIVIPLLEEKITDIQTDIDRLSTSYNQEVTHYGKQTRYSKETLDFINKLEREIESIKKMIERIKNKEYIFLTDSRKLLLGSILRF